MTSQLKQNGLETVGFVEKKLSKGNNKLNDTTTIHLFSLLLTPVMVWQAWELSTGDKEMNEMSLKLGIPQVCG